MLRAGVKVFTKLDDFTGDDTIHSVDPEEEEKDSPFTFIEP